jgi:hypothetical protein
VSLFVVPSRAVSQQAILNDVMFNIEFISGPAIEFGEPSVRGRITLGTFSEVFVSPLVYWSVDDYKNHWLQAAKYLLAGHDKTLFFTTMYDADHANFLFSWSMWRFGEHICMQNQMLFLKELTENFDPQHPYIHVGDFAEHSDEQPISTWHIQFKDIAAYVKQQSQ